MMKFVLVAAVLLHVCLADNWRKELMERLDLLSKRSFKFPPYIRVPSDQMDDNAKACESIFMAKLKDTLGQVNATTSEGENVLQQLRSLLEEPRQVQEVQQTNCDMKTKKVKILLKPMQPYVNFLRTLNSKK